VAAVEITLTTPGALEAIRDRAQGGDCVIGSGHGAGRNDARNAIAGWGALRVSPTLDRSVVRYCKDRGVTCLPGAFTPPSCWRRGAPARRW